MAARFSARRGATAAALGVALGVLPVAPIRTAAQQGTATLTGRVLDRESRAPVSGARIALLGTRHGFASDSDGRFAQHGLTSGTYVLQARAIGYVVASSVVQLGAGQVSTELFELDRLPIQLDPLVVERRPGFAEQRRLNFERRRASGQGYFITEEQIRHAHPRTLGDLFRNVPGVRVQCRGSAGCVMRMARAPRECRPDFVVDGFPATYSTGLDLPTIGITGIEIYRTISETPLEFVRDNSQCGTVVIWTRSGPPAR
jgi:carboxypeptidase family protein